MKIIKWIGAVCAAVFIAGLLVFATPLRQVLGMALFRLMAPRLSHNRTEAEITADHFLNCLRNHSWTNAHNLLTPDCQSRVSVQELQNYWQAIEAKEGKNKGWSGQSRSINLVGAFSNYLETDYRLRGETGEGKASFYIVPQKGLWQIEKVTFMP